MNQEDQKAHGLNLKETHIALTWFFYTPKEAMAKDHLFTQITHLEFGMAI